MYKQLSSVESHLKHLVTFKSLSMDFRQTKALLDYVQTELAKTPLHITRYESRGFPSLIATSKPSFKPKLWLVGHIDVVPAAKQMFEMEIKKDRLIGRGVLDDKFAAASFIEAAQNLGKKVSNYDFGIMLVSDEEVGSENGVKHLINTLDIGGEAAFVPDSGTGWTIQTKAKGGLHFKLTMKGQAAHGSMPWDGINAVDELYAVIAKLRKDLGITDVSKAKKEFLPTLNVGKLIGGSSANQVPDFAEAMIDIRFVEAVETKAIRHQIEELTKTIPGLTAVEMVHAAPVNVSPNNPWIKKYREILEPLGINPELSSSTGATDARFFAEAGITTIVSQPNGGNLHAEGEWIDRIDLNRMPNIVERLVLQT